MTVRYHHWHHAADKEAVDVNFAIHLPFIDRLFGTYHLPKDAWPKRYGAWRGDRIGLEKRRCAMAFWIRLR